MEYKIMEYKHCVVEGTPTKQVGSSVKYSSRIRK
jgi:hypothetical protein